MNIRTAIIATAITLTASIASAEEFDLVIPFAAAGPAQNGGTWRSDVTIHNAGRELLLVRLSYHDSNGEVGAIDLPVPGRTTTTLPDVVRNDFGREVSSGAIVIDGDDRLVRKLSVTSRTYADSEQGGISQEVPAIAGTQAVSSGDTGILNGPSNPTAQRFDAGLFAATETSVEWRLLRRDGTIAKSVEATYVAATRTDYIAAVESLFGDIAQDDDVIHARIRSGRAFINGTVVNRHSGNPGFVQAGRTRENLLPVFVGIDTSLDGAIDFADANLDGTLDQPLTVYTGRFPNGLRVMATDPEGAELSYSIVGNDGSATLLDARGRISWWPSAALKGMTGKLVVRVSDGTDSVDFTIPAKFN